MSTHYISKNAFLKELSKRLEGVDVRKSGRMAKYGFAMKEGESFSCVSVPTMVKAINKVQEGLMVTSTAKVAGSGFIVAWSEKEVDVEDVVDTEPDVKVSVEKPKKKAKKASKQDSE